MERIFKVFVIITLITLISDRLLFVLFPSYLIERGLSAFEIGIIFSLTSFFLAISRFFIGRLSDLIGRKKIMSLGLLIQSISIFLFPFVGKIYEYVVVKGLREIGVTLQSSVEDALKADSFKKNIRARILGKLEAMVPFGRMMATPIGFIVLSLPLRFGFFVVSSLIFLNFLIFSLFFKVPISRPKCLFKRKSYYKKFKVLVLFGFLQSLTYGISYLPAFFILVETKLGISPSTLFVFLFIEYFISTIIVYPSGKWIDKIGRTKTVTFGFLGFGLFIILYAFVKNWLEFLFVLVGVSISYYIWRVAFKTSLYDATVSRIRGEEIGLYETVVGLGDVLAPIVGGLLVEYVSLSSAFIIGGSIGIFAFLLSLYYL